MNGKKRASLLFAAILLAGFWFMAVSPSDRHCPTADEIFHITSGYSYWKTGDYRLQPENGYFPQRWAALPLLFQPVKFPSTTQPAAQNADVAEIGFQFFYELNNPLAEMLRAGRAMNALLGVALGVLVFFGARSLFGAAGGVVSVTLFAFCPHLLAHAGIVTSDIAASLGFVAATLALWRLLHHVTFARVLLAGAALTLLALAKFSALLILPIAAGMFVVRALRRTPLPVHLGRWRKRLRGIPARAMMLGACAGAMLLAAVGIWAAYGFRFSGAPADTRASITYNQPWSQFFPERPTTSSPAPGATLRAVKFARDHRLLPEAYLYGLAHTLHFAGGRPAFFMGDYRTTGWPAFFPMVFLLKTPFSVFAALALAALGCMQVKNQRRLRLGYRLLPLGILLAVYWAFAITSHLNIGHRHILVTYPVLYIFAGAAALNLRRLWLFGAVGLVLAWHAIVSLAFWPNYLAYFNPLLGGPTRAYEHFIDSSLDWGQDLPGLARWIEANASHENVYLSYFGSGHPPFYGVRAKRIGDIFFDLRPREVMPEMRGGVYCISATMFQQVYTLVRHGWTPAHEERYRALVATALDDHGRAQRGDASAIAQLGELEQYQFGRVCAGLRGRTPDAEIGYSILIFRLTDADVSKLLTGPPPFTTSSLK